MLRVWDACASHYLDIRIWMENKKKRELLAYRNLFHFYGFFFFLFCLRWTNKKKRKKKLLTNRFWFSALNTIQSITEQNSNSSRPLAILVSTTSPLPPPQWQRWNSILCTHKVEIRIRTYIYLIHVKFLFALLLLQFFSVL